MHNILLTILSALNLSKQAIREKREPVAPKGTRFDWDAYWADVDKGITTTEQIKKHQKGVYYTTKPVSEQQGSVYGIVDWERYKHDKELYGDAIVEVWRKNGCYNYKRGY